MDRVVRAEPLHHPHISGYQDRTDAKGEFEFRDMLPIEHRVYVLSDPPFHRGTPWISNGFVHLNPDDEDLSESEVAGSVTTQPTKGIRLVVARSETVTVLITEVPDEYRIVVGTQQASGNSRFTTHTPDRRRRIRFAIARQADEWVPHTLSFQGDQITTRQLPNRLVHGSGIRSLRFAELEEAEHGNAGYIVSPR